MKMFVACPQQFFLRLRKFVIRFVNWKIEFVCMQNKFVFPLAHFFTFPTGNSFFVNRKIFIRNDEIRINSDYSSKSFAHFASADRIIETEKMHGRLFESNSVCFESIREK